VIAAAFESAVLRFEVQVYLHRLDALVPATGAEITFVTKHHFAFAVQEGKIKLTFIFGGIDHKPECGKTAVINHILAERLLAY
jgi:hypothetical protein